MVRKKVAEFGLLLQGCCSQLSAPQEVVVQDQPAQPSIVGQHGRRQRCNVVVLRKKTFFSSTSNPVQVLWGSVCFLTCRNKYSVLLGRVWGISAKPLWSQ